MNARMLVHLIGYRGAGKTTLARLAADRLGWDWADTDDLLEIRTGLSIKELFEKEGEADFRDKESAILSELCRRQKHVVATGGGVVLREENRKLLRASGLVVWLKADAGTLWERINYDRSSTTRRPALAGGGIAEVAEMLARREPLYRECAGLIIETAGRQLEELADEIVKHK